MTLFSFGVIDLIARIVYCVVLSFGLKTSLEQVLTGKESSIIKQTISIKAILNDEF